MSAPIRVLAAGDRFILPAIFRDAVMAELGESASVSELEYPWPDEPFGDVAEVSEASGDEDSTIEALRGRQAIVTQLAPITARVLAASPELRFVGVSRGGPVNVDVDVARERGVVVVNAPGRHGIATAEMQIGLMLAVTRRIPQSQATLAAHAWRGEF